MILSLINKGVIELLISILALIFSCIALFIEQRNMKKINRIGLESKFFLTLLESFIATELPEARTKVFYNLPPLDERRRNEEILNLINNVGLININDTNSKKSSGKILGLFRF